MIIARHAAGLAATLLAVAAAPALAEDGPVTHTDQLVVITPNPPVMITQGAPATGPSTVTPTPPARDLDAPRTEPWDQVSHINGTLVKVGEKSDYVLRYRKTNISSNPIGWMLGFYGVSVSHAVHANVAVRLDANVITVDDARGYELGASVPIYFRRVYSGPFLEPGLITRGERDGDDTAASYTCPIEDPACGSGSSSSSDAGSSMVGPQMLFGWHWSFDSGLNVAAAFGIARDLTGSQEHYDSEIEPAGYFRIGYAF